MKKIIQSSLTLLILVMFSTVLLAEMTVNINSGDYDKLSPEKRSIIEKILSDQAQDKVILKKNPSIESADPKSVEPLGTEECKAACDLAATAGKVACFELVVPWEIAACIKAVEEIQKECKKRC